MNESTETILAIDLGSRNVKIGLKENADIRFYQYDTAQFYSDFGAPGEEGFVLNFAKFGISEPVSIIATGYGRNALNIASAEVTPEIQAHAAGAVFQTGLKEFTLIDMGGQDSKVIWVEDGKVKDFYMNNRCAASAGRYLENMARILGMSLRELGNYWEDPEPLSATCAVFGESELVAKLAKGISTEKLAAGVNGQILNRFASKLDSNPPKRVVLVGGVAKSGAIQKLLSIRYNIPIIVPDKPEYNAVIGLLAG